MKKILLLIFVLCIALFVMASCDNYEVPDKENITTDEIITECQHEWVDATCVAPKTCSTCNETEGEALGHNEIIDAKVEPTCTKDGKTEGKHCSRCNEVLLEQEKISQTGHKEETLAAKIPTCMESGFTESKKCSTCGEILEKQTIIYATGHKEEVLASKAPTCTENGLTPGKKCSTCGEILAEQKVIAAFGHTEITVSGKAATCTEDGLTAGKKCYTCGEIIEKQTVISAPGHNEIIIAGKDATCVKSGLTVGKKCSVCGEITLAQKVEEALGHVEIIIPGKDATCTESGLTAGKKCFVCNTTTVAQTTIAATGHKEETVLGKAATCTVNGLTDGKKCTVCGTVTVKQKEIIAIGHIETALAAKAPTCTQTGLTAGKMCTICNEVTKEQTIVAALGHTEITVSGKAATCTEEGLTTGKKCSVCGTVTVAQTPIAAPGHTEVELAAKVPACTKTGLTAGKKCSVCDTVTVAQETVAATGHTEVTIPGKAATCTETGLTTGRKCYVCGEVTKAQDTIEVLGHNEVIVVGRNATCTINGLTDGKKCITCGTITEEQIIISAKGHTEVVVPGKAATCTATGLTDGKKCEVCGVTTVIQVTIAKTRHTEVEIPGVAATCAQTGLTVGKKCGVCGTVTLAQSTIVALGHTYDDDQDETCNRCGFEREVECNHSSIVVIPAVDPTCTQTGLTAGEMCTICNEFTKAQTVVSALGHDLNWSRYCSRCNAMTDASIDGLDIDSSDMQNNMQNIFSGDTVYYETVMFLDKGTTKQLLFPISEIVSVQSFNGDITYVEGRDYTIVDGKLHIPKTSTINVIGSNNYYNFTGQTMLIEKYNGKNVSVYWGDANGMTMWQVRVVYKHSGTWDGFHQENYSKNFEGLIKKLMRGEDVTFIFYGDSITCGASSSWYYSDFFAGKNDKQWSYSMLFTQALADLFGYTINFVDCSALQPGMIKEPPSNYVGGTNGTITYINTSVGGWTSQNGVDNFDKHIKPYIQQYGCDLLGVAFGMNDGNVAPATTANNVKTIYQKAMALDSDFYGLVISTMVPNNLSINGWYGNQYKQEAQLEGVVSYLNSNGVGAGIARVTSMSLSVLDYKDFRDHTGNNINHPNDFMHRIYAQTCLQAFIGYENMK